MSFFKGIEKIIIEEPAAINFKGKNFCLSGDFLPSKTDFAEQLGKLGAIASGIKGNKNYKSSLSLKDTDYLVLADEGITDGTNKKDFGNKVKSVQRHNNKPNQKKHIPIIKESYCKKMIDESMRNRPKP